MERASQGTSDNRWEGHATARPAKFMRWSARALVPIRGIDPVELAQQRGPGKIAVAVGLVDARPHLVERLLENVA